MVAAGLAVIAAATAKAVTVAAWLEASGVDALVWVVAARARGAVERGG